MKLADWLAAQDPPVKPIEFARRLAAEPSTISRLLSGARKPSIEVAARIEQETGGAVGLKDWTGTAAAGADDQDAAGPDNEADPPSEAAA